MDPKKKPCELQKLAFDTCQFLRLRSNNIDITTVKFDEKINSE